MNPHMYVFAPVLYKLLHAVSNVQCAIVKQNNFIGHTYLVTKREGGVVHIVESPKTVS